MPTQAAVKAFARANGLVAKWSVEWQEWIIRRQGASCDTEYYCSDNEEALDQLTFLRDNPNM